MLEADLVRGALAPIMLVGGILIWRSRRFVVGRFLLLIGTLHLSGLWVGRAPVARIFARGFVGEADSAVGHLPEFTDQEMIFWFALWGLWTIFVGQLTIMLERHGSRPPAWFGWQLLLVNLVAALLVPKAGFWWVLIPAYLIIRQSSTSRRADGAADITRTEATNRDGAA